MNATLRENTEAGNQHVRFDEVKVASAKPRRRSLSFNKLMVGALSASICVMVGCSDRSKYESLVNESNTSEYQKTEMMREYDNASPDQQKAMLESLQRLKKISNAMND